MSVIFSPLQYQSLEHGNARIISSTGGFTLTVNNKSWMGYDPSTGWQATEFIYELGNAYGKVITSGLGLGIIQTLLSQHDKVNKIVVYEKNSDVIELFKKIVDYNKFDISKIEIINQDADTIVNTESDCLFLDHFESEGAEVIISKVRNIANNNKTSKLWFWPGMLYYIKYCEMHRSQLNDSSYHHWKNSLNIPNLPEKLTEKDFDLVHALKNSYLERAKGPANQMLKKFEFRNKLIDKFKNI